MIQEVPGEKFAPLPPCSAH